MSQPITVGRAESSAVDTSDTSAEDLRKKAVRFRILIIGRANAGKTTILQKVCNTTEDPEIYNAEGEKVRKLLIRKWSDTD